MINGMSITDILGMSEKVQAFIPQIKKFIPSLVNSQIEFSKKHKLDENQILLYSLFLTPQGKIILYCFKCFKAEGEFLIGTKKFSDTLIIEDEIFRVELTQYLDKIEKEGLMGLIQMLPMDSLTNLMK